jgi:hypothetical protein
LLLRLLTLAMLLPAADELPLLLLGEAAAAGRRRGCCHDAATARAGARTGGSVASPGRQQRAVEPIAR